MDVKAKLNPKIPVTGWPGFLLWAKAERPTQYAALLDQVPIVRDFDNALKNAGLGFDFGSILSSIGSGLASAGTTIANVFTATAPSLLQFGTTLVQAKAAQNLTNTQLQLAKAQQSPAQTAVVQTANGPVTVPMVRNAAGQYVPATVTTAGAVVPSGGSFLTSLANVPLTTWLLVGGVALTAILLLKRR